MDGGGEGGVRVRAVTVKVDLPGTKVAERQHRPAALAKEIRKEQKQLMLQKQQRRRQQQPRKQRDENIARDVSGEGKEEVWHAVFSEEHGKYYFCLLSTGASTWTRPQGENVKIVLAAKNHLKQQQQQQQRQQEAITAEQQGPGLNLPRGAERMRRRHSSDIITAETLRIVHSRVLSDTDGRKEDTESEPESEHEHEPASWSPGCRSNVYYQTPPPQSHAMQTSSRDQGLALSYQESSNNSSDGGSGMSDNGDFISANGSPPVNPLGLQQAANPHCIEGQEQGECQRNFCTQQPAEAGEEQGEAGEREGETQGGEGGEEEGNWRSAVVHTQKDEGPDGAPKQGNDCINGTRGEELGLVRGDSRAMLDEEGVENPPRVVAPQRASFLSSTAASRRRSSVFDSSRRHSSGQAGYESCAAVESGGQQRWRSGLGSESAWQQSSRSKPGSASRRRRRRPLKTTPASISRLNMRLKEQHAAKQSWLEKEREEKRRQEVEEVRPPRVTRKGRCMRRTVEDLLAGKRAAEAELQRRREAQNEAEERSVTATPAITCRSKNIVSKRRAANAAMAASPAAIRGGGGGAGRKLPAEDTAPPPPGVVPPPPPRNVGERLYQHATVIAQRQEEALRRTEEARKEAASRPTKQAGKGLLNGGGMGITRCGGAYEEGADGEEGGGQVGMRAAQRLYASAAKQVERQESRRQAHDRTSVSNFSPKITQKASKTHAQHKTAVHERLYSAGLKQRVKQEARKLLKEERESAQDREVKVHPRSAQLAERHARRFDQTVQDRLVAPASADRPVHMTSDDFETTFKPCLQSQRMTEAILHDKFGSASASAKPSLYERCSRWDEERRHRRSALHKANLDAQMEEATFSPYLEGFSSLGLSLDMCGDDGDTRGDDGDDGDSNGEVDWEAWWSRRVGDSTVEERSVAWVKDKESRRAGLRRLQELKEEQECSFRPKVDAHYGWDKRQGRSRKRFDSAPVSVSEASSSTRNLLENCRVDTRCHRGGISDASVSLGDAHSLEEDDLELPPGWLAFRAENGSPYYFNSFDGTVSWDAPLDAL